MARTDWRRPTEFAAPTGRRRVKLTVAYDGRAFNGWQAQNNAVSVQETILKAAAKLTGQDNLIVVGSGRTDAGVHAKGQVAHIEMDECDIPVRAFCQGLNSFLPKEVRITLAEDVEPSFHARYSAMAREYRYFCRESQPNNPFSRGLVTSIREFPDIEKLNHFAKQIIGTHDFTAFASAQDDCPSKIRDIYESEFSFETSMYGEKLLVYKICGNAFLYHMVRSLTGSMIEFALENKDLNCFKKVLESKDRSLAGKTAPSDGLYLWRVSYDSNEYQWFEEKYGH